MINYPSHSIAFINTLEIALTRGIDLKPHPESTGLGAHNYQVAYTNVIIGRKTTTLESCSRTLQLKAAV